MLVIWYHFLPSYTHVCICTLPLKNTSIYIAASEISSSTRLYKFATQVPYDHPSLSDLSANLLLVQLLAKKNYAGRFSGRFIIHPTSWCKPKNGINRKGGGINLCSYDPWSLLEIVFCISLAQMDQFFVLYEVFLKNILFAFDGFVFALPSNFSFQCASS